MAKQFTLASEHAMKALETGIAAPPEGKGPHIFDLDDDSLKDELQLRAIRRLVKEGAVMKKLSITFETPAEGDVLKENDGWQTGDPEKAKKTSK